VKGHEVALVQGGELITMLWALTLHTGITRPQVASLPVENIEEGIHPSG
jgi:hypothetical protein